MAQVSPVRTEGLSGQSVGHIQKRGASRAQAPRRLTLFLADAARIAQTFHFRTRLFGTGMSLQAFELRDGAPGGYQFEVIGDPQGEPIVLLGRLFEKIRRGLSVMYLEEGDLGLHIAHDKDIVRGRITSDEGYDARMPLLVIDGREVTWEAFGRMLMTFEGWQFKMEIRDRSEEV